MQADASSIDCPNRWARAPRVKGAKARLLTVPRSLQGAFAALVWRDIRGEGHDDAQRLSHFPASPLFCLSWYPDGAVGRVEGPGPCAWKAFDACVMLSGSQSRPTTTWAPRGVRGGMACFTADAARLVFGVEPKQLQDRFVAATAVLDRAFEPLCLALRDAPDFPTALAALEHHVAPRWQSIRGRDVSTPGLGQIGRFWLERLGSRALEWRRTLSARQVERRVKAYSGRSLREWQSLVQTESAFLEARSRQALGAALNFSDLALAHGFSDQAHLIRATRRITGFTPGDDAACDLRRPCARAPAPPPHDRHRTPSPARHRCHKRHDRRCRPLHRSGPRASRPRPPRPDARACIP